MKNYFSFLLLSLILITSVCARVTTTDGQPKMIRTQGVVSGNVECEVQDKNGNIWFSTSGEGVYRFDGKSFKNFTTKDGLCDNNVGAIIQDRNGNIVFGTGSGICTYDGKSFKKYSELDTLRITSLLEDRDGNLWFGAMGKGIYRYDGKTLTNFLNNDRTFNLGNTYQLIQDILQDKNGNLWFGTWNGGGVWRYDGKSFENFLPPNSYYSSNEDGRDISKPAPKLTYTQVTNNITDDMINSLAEDKAGNIWFATRRHGACRYDGKTFTSFRESEGFVSYGVTSVIEDKHGKMWFGTDKNGVFSYDGKVFKNFTTADGLVYDSVRSILEDNAGNLWFGTRGFGLSRFDGKSFTTFSE